MMKKRSTLEVLRHSRHDWLNRLQLIKANMSLGRWDRVNNLIDEIVLESNHESGLTNLHASMFAEYLITFHWEPRLFSMEYEVIGEAGLNLSDYDHSLYKWVTSLFSQIETAVDKKAENHLFLSMHIEEKEIRFFFELSGIIESTEGLSTWIKNQPNGFLVEDSQVSKEGCEMQIRFS
ncbi:stage 0 sporulation protein B (sporulation initiation phosphotransferase) [Bacillus tianshenii]|uniref:Stage 0 sporulation protein B (Sporulation initiation phosphotransferase) n=1 Tax=Sutcliffiella tianshenii TaxID=1463404 RepID=A0ABS2P0F1_9BACI|nr:Spo0B C-terminal domain-containing protein [Bacillus tianshenii]MBM7620441.1 stage 0 sporulation protein B (sporulation initiation phosphotransferase) [Bacillus tianshenii]